MNSTVHAHAKIGTVENAQIHARDGLRLFPCPPTDWFPLPTPLLHSIHVVMPLGLREQAPSTISMSKRLLNGNARIVFNCAILAACWADSRAKHAPSDGNFSMMSNLALLIPQTSGEHDSLVLLAMLSSGSSKPESTAITRACRSTLTSPGTYDIGY